MFIYSVRAKGLGGAGVLVVAAAAVDLALASARLPPDRCTRSHWSERGFILAYY